MKDAADDKQFENKLDRFFRQLISTMKEPPGRWWLGQGPHQGTSQHDRFRAQEVRMPGCESRQYKNNQEEPI